MIVPSKEIIAKYLEIIFGYLDGWIALRSYPEAGKQGKPDMQWLQMDEAAADLTYTFARKANDAGRACYLIPGSIDESGKAGSANVTQFGTILVDIDNGDTKAKLDHLIKHIGEPSLVVCSGGITETNY